MKRIGSVVLCCIGVAAIGTGAALADSSTPNPNQVAAQQCTNELHAMGVKAFKALYGDNAKDRNSFGKCVSSKVRSTEAQQEDNLQNAAQQCRTERGDAGFAAA